jgi:hypothetical protein
MNEAPVRHPGLRIYIPYTLNLELLFYFYGMNRRKAILGIFLAGTGGIVAYSGLKWYDWHKTPDFEYLSNNKKLIAALADTIIPTTDTPGAKEAGVADFIIKFVKDCSDTRSANVFIDGLKEVEAFAFDRYAKEYAACSAKEQELILKHFETKPTKNRIIGKIQKRLMGAPFFDLLKQYTVEGYCTSELGATKGLAYLYIPGSYKGCIPMQPGQKAWATI